MNDTSIATKSFGRQLPGCQPPLNISSRCRARKFGLLALVPLFAMLILNCALAQPVHVSGQLLVDLSANRGLNLLSGASSVPGENNVITWTNYGILGGQFDSALSSVYAATIPATTNPPAFTNYSGVTAPASPAGSRMMVANFFTPPQLQGNSSYSVECWFYNLTTANPRGVFGWTLAAPPAGDAGEFSAAATASWHNNVHSLNWNPAGTAPTTAAWHYGVITYDGTTEKVYLDGSLVNSATSTLNIVATNAAGVVADPVIFSQLGAIPATGTSSSFNGAIAALRVHTDALPAADVANNFAAGIGAVPPPVNLSVQIDPVTAIGAGGTATLNGNLQSTADSTTTALTFLYDTTDHGRTTNGWANRVTLPAPNSVGAFSTNVTGLAPGTVYYVRAYAVNATDTNLSSVVSFRTQGKPLINNSGAAFVGAGSDTLIGNLTLDGDASGTAYVILYWGPTDGGTVPANWANVVEVGTAALGQVSASVSGLTPLGKYYFTFAATNSYGTTFATPSVAFQEGMIFSLNTTNLPAASIPPAAATAIATYPSSAGTFVVGAASGTPTVQGFGGVNWLSTTASPINDNVWLPAAAFPYGTPASIPINGGTVVATIKPTGANGNPWGNIVAVYFSQLGLATSPTTKTLGSRSVASVTINNGGSGYTTPPTVTIAGPGGIAALDSAATATAQISAAGVVTNVIITSGGSGYPTIGGGFNGITVGTLHPPTVTFSAPTSGTTAAGTAVLTPTLCVELLADVNSPRPVDTAGAGSRNTRTGVYLPLNQVSIVSLVAGSGESSGVVGDNNYILYVNGVKVLDTDFGFISGVTITSGSGGSGYTTPPTVTFPAPLAPGGTQAGGVAVLTAGVVTGVTITNAGSGYTGNGIAPTVAGTGNPVVTFSAPPSGTTATGIANGIPLGDYYPATAANALGAATTGRNGGGMTTLNYSIDTWATRATFCIGQDAYDIDPWSGYQGYIGDVYVYGSALPNATRQSLENAAAAKFVTAATLSFNITASVTSGSGTISGPASVVQGFNQTYTITPNPGSGISGVTVDGVSVGTPTTYTFNNVSAAHTISATFIVIPPQTITSSVTGGTGGNISPLGLTNVAGGGSQFFSITASNGFVLSTLVVDGATIANPRGTTVNNAAVGGPNPGYTFVNVGGNGTGPAHTIAVAFTNVSLPVPKSDQIIFSVDTSSLPQTAPSNIVTWPVYIPSTLPAMVVNFTMASTFLDANGVIWEQNIENEVSGNTSYQLGASTTTKQPNTPVNGLTIVCAASPIRGGTSEAWNDIVDLYFGCAAVGIRDDTGNIQVFVNPAGGIANYNTGYSVPSGTNVVVSLVIQPAGNFVVYANTVPVYTNAGTGAFTQLVPGVAGTYANNINIGDEHADTWAGFNGLIGDVFVYSAALSDTDRHTLEAALMTKFHAVVPPNFNWAGANNGNWSSVANWSNTVPLAIGAVPGAGNVPTFSLANAGQTVQVNTAGITVAGLNFNANVVNTIIASTSGNTLTLDSGNTASPTVTVSGGSSPTISANLTVLEGLNTAGNGTLNLAGTVNIGGTVLQVAAGTLELSGTVNASTDFLQIAPNGGATGIVTQNGGTLTTIPAAQSWYNGNGPGVMLGGADNSATFATYNLNGGVLITPSIGSVAYNGSTFLIVPPSTYGGTATLNLNGGVLQASDNDSVDAFAVAEGTAHLIFNTTHTWVGAGGAIINTFGFNNSIVTPLEHNPSGPSIDGGLTKRGTGTLTLLTNSTYTGQSKVQSGVLACELTNSLGGTSVDITDGAKLQLDFAGTKTVYTLTTNGGAAKPVGTYGASGSGAANIDDAHFAGAGTLTVVAAPVSPSIASTVINAGVLILQGTGGSANGNYSVLVTTNLAPPVNWTTVASGSFTSGGNFSNSIPVTNNIPQQFYRLSIP